MGLSGCQEGQEGQEEDQVAILIIKVAETEEILAITMTNTAEEEEAEQNGQVRVVMVRAELQHMVVMEEMVVADPVWTEVPGQQ
jgi:hypothetical protein